MWPVKRFRFLNNAGGSLRGCTLALCFLCMTATVSPVRWTVRPLTPQEEQLRLLTPHWLPVMTTRGDLPPMVDNSTSVFFPAPFNQGANNACSQAAGVRYAYSFEVNRLLNRDASLPENVFSYHFTWNFLNEGENLGSHAFLGYELMKDCGAVPLSVFDDKPYSHAQQTQWISGYQTYTDAMKYRVNSYQKIQLKTSAGIDLLRRYLFDHGDGSETGGVATISCYTDDWGYRSYKGPQTSGIGYIVTRDGSDGPHAVTIVGYDDTVEYDFNGDGIIEERERGAFILMNSWGELWGSEGKCYMPYSMVIADVADGGLVESDAEAYLVEPAIRTPRFVFHVGLSYDRRKELSFIMGAADGNDAKEARKETITCIMNWQGGDFPMQGEGGSDDMEVAFCFDHFMDEVGAYNEPKFFLSIRRTAAKGTGSLNSFSVLDMLTGRLYSYMGEPVTLTKGIHTLSTGPGNMYFVPSCSKWKWLREGTKVPYMSPFILRTATGQTRKFRINGYDSRTGKITITHQKL